MTSRALERFIGTWSPLVYALEGAWLALTFVAVFLEYDQPRAVILRAEPDGPKRPAPGKANA